MENQVDRSIINWFLSDFGTNFSNGTVGGVLLCLLSLLAAILSSAILGWNREKQRHHNAGLRTHILVALGSALIMYISIYGFADGYSRDPARLAAQVVAGIGFLGTGAIVRDGLTVKGLTTATTLWLSMALGLASGAGLFCLTAICTLLAYIVVVVLKKIEKEKKTDPFTATFRANKGTLAFTKLYDYAKEHDVVITRINNIGEDGDYSFSIRSYSKNKKEDLLFLESTEKELGASLENVSFQDTSFEG